MTRFLRNAAAVFRTLLARLRFAAVFVIAAVVVGNWDGIVNHVDQWTRPQKSPDTLAGEAASDVEYYCPMDGAVLDHPGPCPNCGMPLVKRKKADKLAMPADVLARVQITPQRLSLGNIATTRVGYQKLTREVKAVGIVDYDQTKVIDLSARVAGRADELFVNYVGQIVKKGEPLYSIYSPDAFTALREYLQAHKRVKEMAKDAPPDMRADAASLQTAAGQKLLLWGVTADQLADIAATFDKSGEIPTHLPILSPAAGVVVRKEIRQGGYLQAGDTPFTVADLSTVWVNAKIYESDIPLVKVGQEADVMVEAVRPGSGSASNPGLRSTSDTGVGGAGENSSSNFRGKITFLAYQLDPQTRTLDARIELANPDLALRPGMFAAVTFHLPVTANATADGVLSVPRSAVIDTGKSTIVYVMSAPGVFDMRAVTLGPMAGDVYPIITGLRAGDEVVTQGAFLVDAENRLKPSESTTPAGSSMPPGMSMP